MDEESIRPILDEIFSSLEPLDAQSSAVLQFLKAKGLATDEELAPFLEQAGNAASVRWRAVRIRAAAMIASLVNPPEKESSYMPAEKDTQRAAEKDQAKDQQEPRQENSREVEAQEEGESEPQSPDRKAQRPIEKRKAPEMEDAENAA
jgi:hypothetical protein